MKTEFKIKLGVIVLVLAVAGYFLYPNFMMLLMTKGLKSGSKQYEEVVNTEKYKNFKMKAIKLGLDLQGGSHMLLEVQTDEAVDYELNRVVNDVSAKLKHDKIEFESIKKIDDEVIVYFNKRDDRSKGYDILKSWAKQLTYDSTSRDGKFVIEISFSTSLKAHYKDEAFTQALETIRNRIDEFGVTEPVIQRQGLSGHTILLQLPGIKDPLRAKEVIGKVARLTFHLVKDAAPSKEALLNPYNGKVPDTEIYCIENNVDPDGNKFEVHYLLEKNAKVSGDDLEDARVGRDDYNQPSVEFTLSSRGADIFRKLTSENIGKRLAIVLDGVVQSAPNINSTISKNGEIVGSFSTQEATDLALLLRSGALPATVKYIEERTVGPGLGQDSINKGTSAAIIGLILTFIFTILYYRFFGVIADLSLILNIVILLSALAYFGATLTLPGIAGIILTIGMAVDANILVYERIREEVKNGISVYRAIGLGFEKANKTIFDANITTLIAAIVLLAYGIGPVRGFAVTLSIGIFGTLFSVLYFGKFIFEYRRDKIKQINFLTLIGKSNFNFLSVKSIAISLSVVFIIIGIGFMAYNVSTTGNAFNYGIDFAGGTIIQLKFTEDVVIDNIRNVLKKHDLGDSIIQEFGTKKDILIRVESNIGNPEILINNIKEFLNKQFGDKGYEILKSQNFNNFKVVLNNIVGKDFNKIFAQEEFTKIATWQAGDKENKVIISIKDISGKIKNILETNLKAKFSIERIEMVGPQVGSELKIAAIWAILGALIGIIIYISVRFEFIYGIAAIAALVHDVMITLGVFALTGKEISLPIIAALLTIVGYSLNDTIVVFDRIRENKRGRDLPKDTYTDLINSSINQTLSRTLLTSFTTLLVVLSLFIFGGEVINDFAFALMIGVIVGTYSSIYIASPVLVLIQDKSKSVNNRRTKKKS